MKKMILIFGVIIVVVVVLSLVFDWGRKDYTITPPADKSDLIQVFYPETGNTVKSPLHIFGKARGSWFFEASFPVILKDMNGNIISTGIATADGDWMTTEFVDFTADLEFNIPAETAISIGELILKKDNPSGLPENDDSISIPVRFVL